MEKSAIFLGGSILGVIGIAAIACIDDMLQQPIVKRKIPLSFTESRRFETDYSYVQDENGKVSSMKSHTRWLD